MSFDWEAAAEGNAGMPEGFHQVECVKVMRHSKKGVEYTSKDGDPQLYTVWQTGAEEEGLASFTLSAKAGFTLAKALKCAGADLARMKAAGVTPDNFADEDFASKQLVGRKCWVYAEKDGKYTNLTFMEESEVPSSAMYKTAPQAVAATADDGKGYEALEDESIPF